MFPAEAVPLFVEPKKKMTLAYMVLPSYSTSLVNRPVCHPKTMVSSSMQKKKKSHVISDVEAECYNNADHIDTTSCLLNTLLCAM